jgi:Domain of Unknown Function (DUF1259)
MKRPAASFQCSVFIFQLALVVAAVSLPGCGMDALAIKSSDASATQPAVPADSESPDEAQTWQTIASALGRTGVARDHVYVVTIPRDDLKVALDGMAIPTAAGIESEFRFYRCPCGKLNVVGQFCVTDYESNDVAAALMNARFDVASMSPMFLYDKPRVMILRFQAEGSPEDLGKTLHDALGWIGPERTMPQTQP